jgi:hypothetical protein
MVKLLQPRSCWAAHAGSKRNAHSEPRMHQKCNCKQGNMIEYMCDASSQHANITNSHESRQLYGSSPA